MLWATHLIDEVAPSDDVVVLHKGRVLAHGPVARVVADRASGVSFGKIAAALNSDSVPTAQGGKRWYPATVKAVVSGQDAARMRAEK